MPTPTITNVQPLTAEDLAAARMAEDVTFHTSKHGIFVRLYVRGTGDPRIFTVKEQRLFTITEIRDRARELSASASAHAYGDDGMPGWTWTSMSGWPMGATDDPPSCFYSMYDTDSWATIARSLRLGDTLRIQWTADNNTETSRATGLHVDEVRLIAVPADDRKPRNTWKVGTTLCKDNTARTVRRYGN